MTATSVRRVALLFGASALVVLSALPVQAQAPPVEIGGDGAKEAGELIKDPAGKIEEVVGDTTDVVDEIVADTKETVDAVVKETKEKVDDTVQQVEDTVDQVLGGNPSTSDPGREAPQGNASNGNDGRRGGERGNRNDVGSARAERTGDRAGGRSTTIPPGHPLASLQVARAAEAQAAEAPNSAPPITPGEALQSLALPVLMVLAVAVFLFTQGRIDRRDPKLLFTVDVDGERLSFE